MKKFFSYLNIAVMFIALSSLFTACNENDVNGDGNLGLNIKVFSPTVVVPGFPMTINGSGFEDVVEIVFPGDIKVTDFDIVTNEMIRVKAPQGLTETGTILVRNSAGETAVSRLPLSVGKTVVAGYSAQEGDLVKGNETLTIYGVGMQFVQSVEFIDEDGNPIIVDRTEFARIATGRIAVHVPAKVITGRATVKVYLSDGTVVESPEFEFETASEGGHWETVKRYIWQNDGSVGALNWESVYRFCEAGHDFNNECIAEIASEDWDIIKNGTFYLEAQGSDWVQMRITTGWWSTTWTGEDITTGSDRIVDNSDGTYSMEINFAGDPIQGLLDEQHLLFTGGGYTPTGLYVLDQVWVGGEGHFEKVRESFWKNDGTLGDINWTSQYRFCIEGGDSKNECCYEFPAEIWERLKTEPFRIAINKKADWVNIRVTDGWWQNNYMGMESLNDLVEQDEDGNYFVEINLANDPKLLGVVDVQHLLFTGQDYDLLEIYQEEEVWVDGGDGGAAEPIVLWENDGANGAVSWNGVYRFANEQAVSGEEIHAFSMDEWSIIKDGTFYLLFDGGDNSNVRITTGWWTSAYGGDEHNCIDMAQDDPDTGKKVIKINIKEDGHLYDNLDVQHLLFTGSDYTPLKLYYYK